MSKTDIDVKSNINLAVYRAIKKEIYEQIRC